MHTHNGLDLCYVYKFNDQTLLFTNICSSGLSPYSASILFQVYTSESQKCDCCFSYEVSRCKFNFNT